MIFTNITSTRVTITLSPSPLLSAITPDDYIVSLVRVEGSPGGCLGEKNNQTFSVSPQLMTVVVTGLEEVCVCVCERERKRERERVCVCVCVRVCVHVCEQVSERERERVRYLPLVLPQASTYAVLVQTLSGEIGDSPVSSPSYFNTSEGGKFCAFCKISTNLSITYRFTSPSVYLIFLSLFSFNLAKGFFQAMCLLISLSLLHLPTSITVFLSFPLIFFFNLLTCSPPLPSP